MSAYHVPVLLREVLDALAVRPDGVYVDGTAGGGGHSFAMAERLTTGRLIALDQDPDAVAAASARLAALPRERWTVAHRNFAQMGDLLAAMGIPGADGILLAIGVSSHQLDEEARGFSYHSTNSALDMRMSQSGPTAADAVNSLSEAELARILFTYGEEPYARSIARAIVRARESAPIETTGRLADIIRGAVPARARRDGHPARQSFQALRIHTNHELEYLDAGLEAALAALQSSGRLAVITFHSLEDRLVKRRFAAWCAGCTCPRDFPVCVCGNTPRARPVTRGGVRATAEELADNPRSRSATLRCIEKT